MSLHNHTFSLSFSALVPSSLLIKTESQTDTQNQANEVWCCRDVLDEAEKAALMADLQAFVPKVLSRVGVCWDRDERRGCRDRWEEVAQQGMPLMGDWGCR